jgi:hypothetical protein
MMRRRRKSKGPKRLYFTKIHEDAIVEYCQEETTYKRRCKLYEELIQPAFNEMVDKIVFTYRFTTLPNIDELRDECKVWLTTILAKYDPNRGSKAFSYFSVITKNWFIHQVKKTSKRAKREVDIDDVGKEVFDRMEDSTKLAPNMIEEREFWENFYKEMNSWDSSTMVDNELLVYNAVRELFSSANELDILNKKAIYLYLREITGLTTKQIVSQLNKMKKKYRTFKRNWDEGKI